MQQQQSTSKNAFTSVGAVQFRGRFLTAVALLLEGMPDSAFYAGLDSQLERMPHFLTDAPLILDMAQAPDLDGTVMRDLRAALEQRKLAPFGVQNASPRQIEAAAEAGLIPIKAGHDVPQRAPRPERRPEPQPREQFVAPRREVPQESRLITSPVRSGQSVVAEHGDLIVTGHVASGAELIARGNIHVYGILRGRALAGVHGDETARIFCQSLDAELVAIAGLYRTSDNIEHAVRKRSVQIYLSEQRLCMETLA
ncbi:septum site-determining protein MinC [Pontibaca methylaminivorans]|uniref:Probable septum site-determining protein MinC n=2 Tax=Pontibaca methylaminivorans TaxID=515897 RepID=A0A1R3WTV7_9RHOB|nr:septum site-determining protein MinC [Pontibaca methylaminivorans]